MPSPKLGTLVDGAAITKAIGDMKGGRVEYRSASCFWEGLKSANDALPLYILICDLPPYLTSTQTFLRALQRSSRTMSVILNEFKS